MYFRVKGYHEVLRRKQVEGCGGDEGSIGNHMYESSRSSRDRRTLVTGEDEEVDC